MEVRQTQCHTAVVKNTGQALMDGRFMGPKLQYGHANYSQFYDCSHCKGMESNYSTI